MRTHKTFGGMVKAVERLIVELETSPASNYRKDRAYTLRASSLLHELDALWSNPADVTAAAALKSRLLNAFHIATY